MKLLAAFVFLSIVLSFAASMEALREQDPPTGLSEQVALLRQEVASLRDGLQMNSKADESRSEAVNRLSKIDPPVGTVMAYAGPMAATVEVQLRWEDETGWMLCDGRSLPRVGVYSALYGKIGTSHGAGSRPDGTQFHIPDYRGRFLRGVDYGSGRDRDAGARMAMHGTGNSGDTVGSIQDDSLAGHTHSVEVSGRTASDGSHTHEIERTNTGATIRWGDGGGSSSDKIDQGKELAEGADGAIRARLNGSHSHSFSASGATTGTTNAGSETRPCNSAVHWIIRYRNE